MRRRELLRGLLAAMTCTALPRLEGPALPPGRGYRLADVKIKVGGFEIDALADMRISPRPMGGSLQTVFRGGHISHVSLVRARLGDPRRLREPDADNPPGYTAPAEVSS